MTNSKIQELRKAKAKADAEFERQIAKEEKEIADKERKRKGKMPVKAPSKKEKKEKEFNPFGKKPEFLGFFKKKVNGHTKKHANIKYKENGSVVYDNTPVDSREFKRYFKSDGTFNLGFAPKVLKRRTQLNTFGDEIETVRISYTPYGSKRERKRNLVVESETYKAYYDAQGENKEKFYNTYAELMKNYKLPRDKETKIEKKKYFDFRGDTKKLAQQIREVYLQQTKAFKTNISFSYVLGKKREFNQDNTFSQMMSITQGNYDVNYEQYMLRNNATMYHGRFATVRNRADINKLIEPIATENIMENAQIKMPNTKWQFIHFLHVRIDISEMSQTFGCDVAIPDVILNTPAVMAMKGYDDNLCFWRCFAIHKYEIKPHRATKKAKELYKEFYDKKYKDEYVGIEIDEFYKVEEKFQVAINAYSYNEKEKTATLERLSVKPYKDEMCLLKISNHMAYIKDISWFLNSFQCSRCKKLFKTNKQLQRHTTTCDALCKHEFVGGNYKIKNNVFDKLEKYGIKTRERMYHDYFAVFDFEVFLEKVKPTGNEKKLIFERKHIPSSVSVCSNIPGFTDSKCIIDFEGDVQKFIDEWIAYLFKLSKASKDLMMDKCEKHFEAILKKQERVRDPKDLKQLRNLYEQLEDFCGRIPVVGFNSGRYDLPAIKKYFFTALKKIDENVSPIRRANTYMAVRTPQFSFLDIVNFLAPGFSYEKFLKAYDCSADKGFFPYEWFDSRDKLMTTELPKHEDFYSTLKGKNISEEEYAICEKAWSSLPKDADDKVYFHQFLKWYNDLDVEPFVEAIEKMFQYYRVKDLDLFQDGISVPGLTMKYLFGGLEEGVTFSLFEEKDKDLYYDMKNNIVGGPSIIFNRYQEVGKTTIREGGKPTKSVLGLDANALYLWGIQQEMPSQDYERIDANTTLNKVNSGEFFGFVMCDIYTPDHLKEYFSEFPPIFKNTTIPDEAVGQHTQDFMKKTGAKIGKCKKLISSFFGNKVLIYTPLLNWYLKMGLVVRKVYYGLQFTSNPCFKQFGDDVSCARRLGDKDPAKAIQADTAKLFGNSAYGKTATNKEKHTNVRFATTEQMPDLIAKHTYKGNNQLGEDTFEVSQFKEKIKMDLPLQIACAVYQLAKLRMLDFFYNCLDKFVDRSNYEMVEMDTDSFYMGLGEKTFDECLKPEMLEQWKEEKYLWFPRTASKKKPTVIGFGTRKGETVEDLFKSGAEGVTFCEDLLEKGDKTTKNKRKVLKRVQEFVHQAYDKRTPGLFKEEFRGTGIVALCSKTYFCWDDEDGKDAKFSCKGVNKNINDIRKEKYLSVLETGQSVQVKNRGFRLVDNQMQSYSQQKTGFSYLYVKRKLRSDGIRTDPLEI